MDFTDTEFEEGAAAVLLRMAPFVLCGVAEKKEQFGKVGDFA